MPNYAFNTTQAVPHLTGSPGYKFASIHDSGLLLKFDMRQPGQFEKKINAHTGPGLCLNWHPHENYIATGGRDGKCCLWYVGDRQQLDSNSYTNSNLIPFPELTINTGSPVTKLKFRPAYDADVFNSLLALSSMGEEAEVCIYSLARKYIPKHVLLTSAPSVGLVWWDNKLLFNIDKNNYINGWNIEKEPTVLDNIPKNVTTWRDMDGNGLLSIDQKIGTYENTNVNHTYTYNHKKTLQRADRSSSTNNFNPNGLLNTLKKGANLSMAGDRPLLSKIGTSLSTRSVLQSSKLNSNSNISLNPTTQNQEITDRRNIESPFVITLDLPHILNNIRLSEISNHENLKGLSGAVQIKDSPVEIFKYLARELEFSYTEEKLSDKDMESTFDGFKMEKSSTQNSNNETGLNYENLRENFGLSEKATWINLIGNDINLHKINSTIQADQEDPLARTSTGRSNSSRLYKIKTDETDKTDASSKTSPSSYNSESPVDKEISKLTERIHNTTASRIQKKMEVLIKLVSICAHNSSVYAYIGDLPNFKVWMLIRDSLLWDLKRLNNLSPENVSKGDDDFMGRNNKTYDMSIDSDNGNDENDDENNSSNIERESSTANLSLRKQSVASDYSRFTTSDPESLIEERPQAFNPSSAESQNANASGLNISNLRKQLKGSDKTDTNKVRKSTIETLRELRKIHRNKEDNLNTDVIEEQTLKDAPELRKPVVDESVEPPSSLAHDLVSSATISDTSKGIPIIRKRSERLSFIDTFMTEPHSPKPFIEEHFTNKFKYSSPTFSQNSPRSSGAFSSHNFSHTSSQLALFKKSAPHRLSEGVSIEAPDSISDQLLVEDQTAYLKNENKLAPWNTKKLLRQIYNQAVETGNILLVINMILLFQDLYQVTSMDVVKDSLAHFMSLLHRYELFEIATSLIKYCPWEGIMGSEGGQSTIQLFCDKCGELITNDLSKENFTKEAQKVGNRSPLSRFGHWYCDSCKKPNSLCIFCERPMKKLTMAILQCGHEAHFQCFRSWFLDDGMDICPAGCLGNQLA